MKYPRKMKPVFKAAGGASKLARLLEITPSAIYQWRKVPKAKVAAVACLTGIPEHVLRPDLYPADSPPAASPTP